MQMKLGLWLAGFQWPESIADTLGVIATRAERAGLDSMWIPDHLLMPKQFGNPDDNMLEAWTTLGFLAGVTNRLQLGTLVSGVTYRNAGLLIKMLTTLDVLSHGRAYLGIGAAWYEEEHAAYGFPYPATAERFELLEDALQLAHQMLSKQPTRPFQGRHLRLEYPHNAPPPVRRPPILVAGGGEKKTLRLVAQYADTCNFFLPAGEEETILKQKISVLKEHCREVGRNFEEIEITSLSMLTLSDQSLDFFQKLRDLGVKHALFGLTNQTQLEPFERLRDHIVPGLSH